MGELRENVMQLLRWGDVSDGTLFVSGGEKSHKMYLQKHGVFDRSRRAYRLSDRPHQLVLSRALKNQMLEIARKYGNEAAVGYTAIRSFPHGKFAAIGGPGTVDQEMEMQQVGASFKDGLIVDGVKVSGWLFGEDVLAQVQMILPGVQTGMVPGPKKARAVAVVSPPSSGEKATKKRTISEVTVGEDED